MPLTVSTKIMHSLTSIRDLYGGNECVTEGQRKVLHMEAHSKVYVLWSWLSSYARNRGPGWAEQPSEGHTAGRSHQVLMMLTTTSLSQFLNSVSYWFPLDIFPDEFLVSDFMCFECGFAGFYNTSLGKYFS